MSDQIIGLQDWFQTPAGQYLLEWEHQQFDSAVADIFGYHALQLGLPQLAGLQANRMPHRWLAVQYAGEAVREGGAAIELLTDFAALPFPACSLDLVVLPHTLEFSADPHATLREVERVLVPDGRVVLCGMNPTSLWGLRQRRTRLYQKLGWGRSFLPECGGYIGYWRLRDWLRLLSFEVEEGRFGCYRPAVDSPQWLQRMAWMDRMGPRWWTIFGAAYFVVAVKRVRGVRMLGAAWRTAPALAKQSVPAAQRMHPVETRKND
jgi:SAM-dependent methyltransferase